VIAGGGAGALVDQVPEVVSTAAARVAHRQAFFAVEPLDPLAVHDLALRS